MHLLLASDFDGTIVPRTTTADPQWNTTARSLFSNLQASSHVTLAVISGRDPEELAAAMRGIRCYTVGSYGRHVRDPLGNVLRDAPTRVMNEEDWAWRIRDAGGIIERKRHGVAIHWTAEGARQPAGVAAFEAWAQVRGLRVVRGVRRCEAVVPGPGKLSALRALQRLVQADAVIYAGDDRSDYPAVRWAARHGAAFYISSRAKRTRVDGVTIVSTREKLWQCIGELTLVRDALRKAATE